MISVSPKVIVALDYDNQDDALALAAQLDPTQCRLKVGKSCLLSPALRLLNALLAAGLTFF